MRPSALIPAVVLFAGGCASRQTWYPPPAQKPSMGEAWPGTLGHFVYMSEPDAGLYIAGGMRAQSEGPWRWAHDHPVLRFYLPEVGRINFRMDFTLPENNFRQTGPVTLTFALNGHVFDRLRCNKPGQQQYDHPVPLDLLHTNAVNLVAITPDKTSGRPEGGERLGFVLTSAGFAE